MRPSSQPHARKRLILAVLTGLAVLIAAPFIAIAMLSNKRSR